MPGVRFAAGVFACVLPLAAQADDLRARVSRALDQARPALLAHLKDATQEGVRPGQLALLLLAAIHDGVPATDPVFAAAIEKLAKANPEETYDLALRLLVMEAFAEFPERAAIGRRDARELLTHRDDSGAFSYGRDPTRWDLSNTQYAALGLRAAKALGVVVERGVWTKLAREVGDQQDSYGGFGYVARPKRPGNARTEPKRGGEDGGPGAPPPGPWAGDREEASYASMTAAGIAVLAICRQALGEEEQKNSALAKGISRGWTWFDRNVAAIGSPTERWSYYFHYGLERAAILCDVEKVAGRDWYELGAEMLVRDQLAGGGWHSQQDGGGGALPGGGGRAQRGKGQAVSTAFAILFLRRKFQKLAGPTTPRAVALAAIGPNSRADDIEAAAADLVRRGKPAMPEVLSALRSELEAQRKVAAKALAALAGDTFGYDPARDAEANRGAVVKAELWWLRNR